MMQVSLVPAHRVDQVWPFPREGFQRFIDKTGSGISTGDLWVKCRSGGGFLLVAHDEQVKGASIWECETRASGRKLRCVALNGVEMTNWIHDMRALAISIAKDCGANGLLSEGRLGWKRVFPKARILSALYEEPIDGR